MTRDEAIKTIEQLYPADDRMFPDAAMVGQSLLEQAQNEVGTKLTWRNEPTKVLIRYAELCLEEEKRQTRAVEKRLAQYAI